MHWGCYMAPLFWKPVVNPPAPPQKQTSHQLGLPDMLCEKLAVLTSQGEKTSLGGEALPNLMTNGFTMLHSSLPRGCTSLLSQPPAGQVEPAEQGVRPDRWRAELLWANYVTPLGPTLLQNRREGEEQSGNNMAPTPKPHENQFATDHVPLDDCSTVTW